MDENRKDTSIRKSKRGRPSLGDVAKRVILTVRVHHDEFELWKSLAEQDGITLSDFVLGPLRRSLKKRKVK